MVFDGEESDGFGGGADLCGDFVDALREVLEGDL
jgi:hypothetical protein